MGGPGQVFYLRGAALDEYIDGSWRRGPRQYEEDTLIEGAPVNVLESSRRAIRMTQATTLRSAARNGPVFVAWQPVRVRPTAGNDRMVLTPETLTLRRDGGSGMVSYEADLAWPRQDPDVEYERYGASFDSEVVRRHALAALAGDRIEPDPAKRPVVDDQRAARAIESYLSKRFAYSLQAGASPMGSDPIDWFLDVRKAGHCEYFASAMAAMCRSVGMESRVIAGYVATEWNETQDAYVVRESNAHAWTEVEIGGGYWMTCDPSPQDELHAVQRGNDRLASWFGRFLDDMNYAWNRGVVAFDENRRVSLLGAEIASPLSGSPLLRWLVQSLRPSATEAKTTAIARGLMLFFAVLAVGAGLVLGGRVLSRLWNRFRGRSVASLSPTLIDPWQRGLLRALARHGVAKPYWRPLLMHVDHIVLSDAERSLARRVAWASYRSRFGLGLSAQERADAIDALRRLESRA
jgi:transglutaminase-like putative cysteine protease